MKNEWKWMFGYIKQYRLGIFVNVIFGFVGVIMGLGSGVASKYLIDDVISQSHTFVRSAALVICLALFQIILQAAASRVASNVGAKVSSEVRGDVFSHMMYARVEDIGKYHSG